MRYLALLVALALPFTAGAGLQASFSGSRLSGMGDQYTIFEYDGGTLDGSGNLIDTSGENLLLYSEAAGSWTLQTATVTSNSVKSPIDNALVADTLHEDATAGAVHGVYQAAAITSGYTYTYSTDIHKAARQWFALSVNTSATDPSAYFDLTNGVVGTATSCTSGIRALGHGWYRIWLNWTSDVTESPSFNLSIAEADGDVTFDGLDQDSTYVVGMQLVKNDSWLQGPGKYIVTGAVNKPRLDLAPTGTPPSIETDLQGADGNKLMARSFDGSSQRYSKAPDSAMNVLDQDHTVTWVAKRNSTSTGAKGWFSKGAYNAAGVYVMMADTNEPTRAVYSKAGAYAVVYGPAGGFSDGRWHIHQMVRNADVVTIYADGIAGTPVDVTTYGIDGNEILYLADANASYPLDGSILYSRLDSRALSTADLARDREQIQGILSNHSKRTPFTYTRTTTAFKNLSTGGISNTAINVPRVSGDGGGVLIEGQSTNLCLQSQTLGTTWTQVALTSVSTDGHIAPDGTTTADGAVATAVDTQHGFSQAITLTAVNHNGSIFAHAGDKTWVYAADSTVANATAYYNLTSGLVGTVGAGATAKMEHVGDGWWRLSAKVLGTAAAHTWQFYSAEADGDNSFAGDAVTVNTWFWGGQVEAGSFPTSYIPTTTGSVIRTADNMTLDPHPASSTDWTLPETFCATCPASKLTIEFDARCEWSANADMDSFKGLLSIGTIRIYGDSNGAIYAERTPSDYNNTNVDAVVYSSWNRYKFFIDFADLSRSLFSVNDVSFTNWSGDWTGTDTLTSNTIQIGDWLSNPAFCSLRNVRIEAAEF